MDNISGMEVIQALSKSLEAIGNPLRYEIVNYCLKQQNFSNIIKDLRLNPASFKFHLEVLTRFQLIKKVKRGVYETTELGKLLLTLIEQIGQFIDN
jgi:predicted transcriptional regulator